MPTSKKKKSPQRQRAPQRASSGPATSDPATFPIVAIGASAGGLEAFSNLLRALPAEPGLITREI